MLTRHCSNTTTWWTQRREKDKFDDCDESYQCQWRAQPWWGCCQWWCPTHWRQTPAAPRWCSNAILSSSGPKWQDTMEHGSLESTESSFATRSNPDNYLKPNLWLLGKLWEPQLICDGTILAISRSFIHFFPLLPPCFHLIATPLSHFPCFLWFSLFSLVFNSLSLSSPVYPCFAFSLFPIFHCFPLFSTIFNCLLIFPFSFLFFHCFPLLPPPPFSLVSNSLPLYYMTFPCFLLYFLVFPGFPLHSIVFTCFYLFFPFFPFFSDVFLCFPLY